jgi:hypothetical protein
MRLDRSRKGISNLSSSAKLRNFRIVCHKYIENGLAHPSATIASERKRPRKGSMRYKIEGMRETYAPTRRDVTDVCVRNNTYTVCCVMNSFV